MEAPFRDKIMLLPAPFGGPPTELLRTESRFLDLKWSAEGAALVWARWYATRTTTISFVEPSGEARPYMKYDYSDVPMGVELTSPHGRRCRSILVQGSFTRCLCPL